MSDDDVRLRDRAGARDRSDVVEVEDPDDRRDPPGATPDDHGRVADLPDVGHLFGSTAA